MLPLDLSKPKSFTEAVRTVLEKMGKVVFKYAKRNLNLLSMFDTKLFEKDCQFAGVLFPSLPHQVIQ